MPLLNKEQEQHLFRQMNFLKHKLKKVVDRFRNPDGTVNAANVRIQDLEAIERLQEQADGGQGYADQLQHAAGGFDRQAACRRRRTTSSSCSATATCR